MSDFDLLVVGRPSVDVMFSGLKEWPALGNDVEADGLGVSAGTAFNTPAAASRLGLRVAFVATIGNDAWSDLIHAEWASEDLPEDFLLVEERPLPGVQGARDLVRPSGERLLVLAVAAPVRDEPAVAVVVHRDRDPR